MIDDFRKVFERDIRKLRSEISSYNNDDRIWHTEKNIANSAGNLCLHLVGNLKTYIGNELGGIGFIRDRESEFTQKGISKLQLLDMIDSTLITVSKTFDNLPENRLQDEFPVLVFKEKTSVAFMLIHLAAHLDYHLGQINYHRRLLDH